MRVFITLGMLALVAMLGLNLGGWSRVAARDAAPGIGEAITILDEEGAEVGLTAVTDVADPFTDFNPDRPPEAGFRYVVVTVAFENTGGAPFDARSSDIVLQDTDGGLWTRTSVPRTDDVVVPELQNSSMAPGNRISGVVGFVVPSDVEIQQVLYLPARDRVLSLGVLQSTPAPVLGDAATYVDPDGGEASISVTEVANPFTDFNPDQPPEDGTQYVLVTVSFENTGQRPFEADPYDIVLRGVDGQIYDRANVPRLSEVVMPELASQSLAPGNRISGVVGFVVPAGTEIAGVHYRPESDRLVLLADLGAAPDIATPAAGDGATPAAG